MKDKLLTLGGFDRAKEWIDAALQAIQTRIAGILPSMTGNAGKVLSVNSNADGVVWIPLSGGGDGFSDYNFTHTANEPPIPVPTPTVTITYAANTRGSRMITVNADIGITFAVNNSSDNYLWIANGDTANDVDITVSAVTHGGNAVSNVYMPADGITVPAGGVCEIGVIVNADGAFITSRNDLAL